jgi:hypothetical protein
VLYVGSLEVEMIKAMRDDRLRNLFKKLGPELFTEHVGMHPQLRNI